MDITYTIIFLDYFVVGYHIEIVNFSFSLVKKAKSFVKILFSLTKNFHFSQNQ